MFYSQHVLTRKGPLAKIWLAAHMQSKLTKAMVFATDLCAAIETILQPPAPMALRLTSSLLLGVARILHRKTKYLLQESAEALTKLKLAFRPTTSVDLPASSAPNFAAVTLADGSVDGLAAPMVDISRVPRARSGGVGSTSAFLAADRDITIDEFVGGLVGGMLDAFGRPIDLGLDRDNMWDASGNNEPLLFTPSQRGSTIRRASVKEGPATGGQLQVGRVTPASVDVLRAAADGGDEGQIEPVLSLEKTEGAEDKNLQSEGVLGTDDMQRAATEDRGNKSADDKEIAMGSDVDMLRASGDEQVTPLQLGTPPPIHAPSTADARLSIGEPLSVGTPAAAEGLQNLDSGSVDGGNDAGEDDALPEEDRGASNEEKPDETLEMGPALELAGATPGRVAATQGEVAATPEGVGATPEEFGATPEEFGATPEGLGATPEGAGVARLSTGSVGFQLTEGAEAAEAAEEEKAKAEMRETAAGEDEPIDSPAPARRGRKRKHTLIEDPETELSVDALRANLNDTSDLVYGPNERRRRGERVRRAPLRLQDLLSRPTTIMAPELSELFAESFRIDDTRDVGSPMSDADLGNLKGADKNAPGEKEMDDYPMEAEGGDDNEEDHDLVERGDTGEDGQEAVRPEDSGVNEQLAEKEGGNEITKTPQGSKSAGPDLPGPSPDEQLPGEEGAIVAMSQSAAALSEKSGLADVNVEISGEKRLEEEHIGGSQTVASHATARRLSFPGEDPAIVPQAEEAVADDNVHLFDTAKISLRDVANTRSQVSEQNGVAQDVTESTVSARTRKMQDYIREHVDEEGVMDFTVGLESERNMSRRTAARTFYELLNLSSKKAVILKQDGAFGRITARPVQPTFDSLSKTKDG